MQYWELTSLADGLDGSEIAYKGAGFYAGSYIDWMRTEEYGYPGRAMRHMMLCQRLSISVETVIILAHPTQQRLLDKVIPARRLTVHRVVKCSGL